MRSVRRVCETTMLMALSLLCVMLLTVPDTVSAQITYPNPMPDLIISAVHPATLSVAGGVPLTIFGNYFPVNTTSEAELKMTVNGIVCPIDLLVSSPTKLVCPRSPPGNLPAVDAGPKPKVSLETRQFTVPLLITHKLVKKQISIVYELDKAPVLNSVSGAVVSGEQLTFDTDFGVTAVTSVTEQVDVKLLQDSAIYNLNATVSSSAVQHCNFDAVYSSFVPNSVGQPAGAPGHSCTVDGVFPGLYNASISAKHDAALETIGAAVPSRDSTRTVFQLADDGTPFTTAVYPTVTSTSPASSSVAGGTTLTIQGSGFNTKIVANDVFVSDVPCSVTSAQFNQLECTLPTGIQANTTSSTIAGSGLLKKVYTGITSATLVTKQDINSLGSAEPSATTYVMEEIQAKSFPLLAEPIIVEYSGLFNVAHTAAYTFYCSASDIVTFKLSFRDGSGRTVGCTGDRSSADRGQEYYEQALSISEPVTLTAGTLYDITATYGAGSKTSWVDIKMSHSAPILPLDVTKPESIPQQSWSLTRNTLVLLPRVSHTGDFRTQSFTIEYNATQLRIPGVGRSSGTLCSSVSIAKIMNGQFPDLHLVESVRESTTCAFFLTTLHPTGFTSFKLSGVDSRQVLAGSSDWWYERLPTRYFLNAPVAAEGEHNIRVVSNGFTAFESKQHSISLAEPVPEIHSMVPTIDISPGTRLTIKGANLDTPSSDIKITFGAAPYQYECGDIETFIDGRTLNCRVPSDIVGGLHLGVVQIGSRARISEIHPDYQVPGIANTTLLFIDVTWEITQVRLPSTAAGSMHGGTVVKIDGTRIPPNTGATSLTVSFGGAKCRIIEVIPGLRITCITSPFIPKTNDTIRDIITESDTADGSFLKWNMNGVFLTTSGLPQILQNRSINRPNVLQPSIGFSYYFDKLPVIHAISPPRRPSGLPTTFSIEGENLVGTVLQLCNGGACVLCRTDTIESTNGTCTVGPLPPGLYDFLAYNEETYRTGFSKANNTFESFFDVESISPQFGSLLGGAKVTLTGNGFTPGMRVKIGPTNCPVDEVTETGRTAICTTSPYPVAAQYPVVVDHEAGPVAECLQAVCQFGYNTSTADPRLVALVPRTGQQETLTVTGVNFPPNPDVTVTVGAVPCNIESSEESTVETEEGATLTRIITCKVSSILTAGTHRVSVTLYPHGNVRPERPELLQFQAALSLTRVVPLQGSCAGGTLITIEGVGFGDGVSVSMGSNLPCQYGPLFHSSRMNATEIVCHTSKRQSRESALEAIIISVGGVSVTAAEDFRYGAELTQEITDMAPLNAQPGSLIRVKPHNIPVNQLIGFYVLDQAWPFDGVDTSTGRWLFRVPEVPAFRATGFISLLSGNGWVNRPQKLIMYPNIERVDTEVSLQNPTVRAKMSFAGGNKLIIKGKYFTDADMTNNLQVTICGQPCKILNATASEINCTAPALSDRTSMLKYETSTPHSNILSGKPYVESVSDTSSHVTDGDSSTIFSATRTTATLFFVGVDIGVQQFAWLQRIWFFPAPGKEASFNGASVQISKDTITWTTITTIRVATSGWNAVILNNYDSYARYVRLVATDTVKELHVAEISVEGVLGGGARGFVDPAQGYLEQQTRCLVVVQMQSAGSDTMSTCDERPLLCSELDTAMTIDYNNEYSKENIGETPTVAVISPKGGPSSGGTKISISGNNIDPTKVQVTPQFATVHVDGVPCDIVDEPVPPGVTKPIVCMTRPKSPAKSNSKYLTTDVYINGKGLALVSSPFLYEDAWSSPLTWEEAATPVEGSIVVIPKGVTVTLDQSPPTMTALIIQGTVVTAERGKGDIDITATYIIIDGGWLRIGDTSAAYPDKVTITLVGDKLTPELPRVGSKVLAVDGGKLELYGLSFSRTQTQLIESAKKGDNSIVVQEATLLTQWVGLDVAITTTSGDFEQTEYRKVLEISGSRMIVDQPLQHDHAVVTETHGDHGASGSELTFQTKVLLLSRKIIIQGDSSSEDSKFGGHIFINSLGKPSFINLVHVELTKMGQQDIARRHPLNFYNEFTGARSSVSRCAVHHTYNRGIVLENTNKVRISETWVVDTIGHGISLYGGASRFNQLYENMVYVTRAGKNIDQVVASIHVSHPSNNLVENTCGGSAHMGLWLNFEELPLDPTLGSICPNEGQLGYNEVDKVNNVPIWTGGTYHSNGMHGMWVYPKHHPRTEECGSPDFNANPIVESVFNRIQSFMNGGQGIALESVSNYRFTSYRAATSREIIPTKLYDNGDSGFHVSEILRGTVTLYGTLIVAHSTFHDRFKFKALRPTVGVFGVRGPGSDGLLISNTTFEGFSNGYVDAASRAIPHYGIQTCSLCGTPSHAAMGGYVTNLEGLVWVNSQNIVSFAAPYNDYLIDTDGSTVKREGSNFTILPEYNHVADMPSCSRPRFVDYLYFNIEHDNSLFVMICNSSYTFHRVTLYDIKPATDHRGFRISTTSVFGSQQWNMSTSVTTPWMNGFVIMLPTGTLVYEGVEIDTNYLNTSTLIEGDVSWSSTGIAFSHHLQPQLAYLDFTLQYTNVYVRMDIFDRVEITPNREALNMPVLEPLPALRSVVPTIYSALKAQNLTRTAESNPTHCFLDTNTKRMTARFTPVRTNALQRNTILDVNALKCSSSGCIFMMPPVDPPVNRSWVDPRAWAHHGGIPTDGDEVVIPPGMTVTVSSNTSRLRSLIVQGTLRTHARLDTQIITNFLVIYGGKLETVAVGATTTPKITIDLVRDPEIPNMGIDDGLVLESGSMLVCGEISISGKQQTSWSPLNNLAEAQKNSVKLTREMAWNVGDFVAITSGSYKASEAEQVRIRTSVPANREFTTTDALAHEHIAATVDVTDEQKFQLEAKAALLSRSLVIRGVSPFSDASTGCSVVISEYGFDSAFAARGSIRNTEFRYCGVKPRDQAAVTFKNVRRNPFVFSGNVVRNSFDTALRFHGTSNVRVESSVFYHSEGSTVEMGDSSFNLLQGNLAFGTIFEDEFVKNNATKPRALCSFDSRFAINTWIDNVAGGSQSEGFCVQPPPCFDPDVSMSGNEAHSNVIGWFSAHVTPHPKTGEMASCVRLDGVKAWHNSYVGIYSAINADSYVINAKAHDNHISYYVGREGYGNSTIHTSIVGGRASNFDAKSCEYFQCTTNTIDNTCKERAEVYQDSSRTFQFGEIGIMLPTFLEKTKHAEYSRSDVDLPIVNARNFDKVADNGALYITNVIFSDFQFGRDFGKCSGSTAIATNGMSVLPVVPTYIENATSYRTVQDSKLYIHDPSSKWSNNDLMCGDHTCDGLRHVAVTDVDGEYISKGAEAQASDQPTPPVVFVSNYENAALGNCTFTKGFNVYTCMRSSYGELHLKNLDTDAWTRTIEPFELQDEDFLARIISNIQPPDCVKDDCDGGNQKFVRDPRFNTVLQTEHTYLADFGSEEPRRVEYHFRNCKRPAVNQPPSAIILRVAYPSPVMDLSVWVKGVSAPIPYTENQIRYSQPAGTNYFELTDNRLYLLLPCESVVEVHQIVTATLGLKIGMRVQDFVYNHQEFFAASVANFLSVRLARIRIVEVYPSRGTTIVSFRIIANDGANYNSTKEADEVNQLVMTIVAAGISRLANQLKLPVVDIEYIEWAVGTPASENPADVSVPLSGDIIAVISVLAVVTFFFLLFIQWRIYKKLLKYKDFEDQLAKEQDVEFPDINHPGFDIDMEEAAARPRVEIGLRSLKIKVDDDEAEDEETAFGGMSNGREPEFGGGGGHRSIGYGANAAQPPAGGFGQYPPGWANDSMVQDSMEYD